MFLLKMVGEIRGVIKFGRAIFLWAVERVFLKPGAIVTGWPTNLLHHVVDLTGEVIKGIQHGEQTGSGSFIDFRGRWTEFLGGPLIGRFSQLPF